MIDYYFEAKLKFEGQVREKWENERADEEYSSYSEGFADLPDISGLIGDKNLKDQKASLRFVLIFVLVFWDQRENFKLNLQLDVWKPVEQC